MTAKTIPIWRYGATRRFTHGRLQQRGSYPKPWELRSKREPSGASSEASALRGQDRKTLTTSTSRPEFTRTRFQRRSGGQRRKAAELTTSYTITNIIARTTSGKRGTALRISKTYSSILPSRSKADSWTLKLHCQRLLHFLIYLQ